MGGMNIQRFVGRNAVSASFFAREVVAGQLTPHQMVSIEVALEQGDSESARDLADLLGLVREGQFTTREALANAERAIASLARNARLFEEGTVVVAGLEKALARRDASNPFYNEELGMCLDPLTLKATRGDSTFQSTRVHLESGYAEDSAMKPQTVMASPGGGASGGGLLLPNELDPKVLLEKSALANRGDRDALDFLMAIPAEFLKSAAEKGMDAAVFALRSRWAKGDETARETMLAIDRNKLGERIKAKDHKAVRVLLVLVDDIGDSAYQVLHNADPTPFIQSFLETGSYEDAVAISSFAFYQNRIAVEAVREFSAEQLGRLAQAHPDLNLFSTFRDAGNPYASAIADQLLDQIIRGAEADLGLPAKDSSGGAGSN